MRGESRGGRTAQKGPARHRERVTLVRQPLRGSVLGQHHTDYTTAPGDDVNTECGPVTKTDLILHLKTELKLPVPVLLLPALGAGPPTPASHSPRGCEPRPVPHGFNLPHANTCTTCFTVQIKSTRHHGAG